MKTSIKPRDLTDKWIAQVVPDRSFVDIGGIGGGGGNERVTFAHSACARSCVMADLAPTTRYE